MSDPITNLSNKQTKPLLLFDVDNTLSLARQKIKPEVLQLLKDLRKKCAIGFVGGSDMTKLRDQLEVDGVDPMEVFDYGFPENGLAYYKGPKLISEASFIQHVGEEKYKPLVNFILHYIADMDIPIKRGTFLEFRKGMINVSPIGRNASTEERNAFEEYDKKHQVRAAFIRVLQEKFADYDFNYVIGGQISFDVYPRGWDKTYCLRHVEKEGYQTIHFFGDKTWKGGNDYEIFADPRTIGHTVTSPDDTVRLLKELFF